jgi:hypothetical protein
VILEDVGDAHRGLDPLHPALHQFQVGVVAQAEFVQPLGLRLGDVAGRRTALGVRVFVVPDEGLPVLVARPLDRVSNLLPGERHRQPPLHFARSGQPAPTLPAVRSAPWP